MGLILLVVLGIVAIIVLNVLKAQGVSLPGVSFGAWLEPPRAEAYCHDPAS
jgi:hypothetical protein